MLPTIPPRNDALSKLSIEEIAEQISALERIDRQATSFVEIRHVIKKLMNGYSCITRKVECHQAWRSRINRGRNLFTNVGEIWYPKPEYVKSYGRLNEPHSPMLYVSASHQTSLLEARPSKGDLVTILEMHLKKSNVLPHVMELGVAEKASEHGLSTSVNLLEQTQWGRDFLGQDIHKNLAIRSFIGRELVRIVDSGNPHQFKVTAAIASILMESERIDGIEYPSISGDGSGKGGGVNLALKPEASDRLLTPHSCFVVEILEVNEGQYLCQRVARTDGIRKDGSLIWS